MTATRRDFLRSSTLGGVTLAGVAATAAPVDAKRGDAATAKRRDWRVALALPLADWSMREIVETFVRQLALLGGDRTVAMPGGSDLRSDGITALASRGADLYLGSEALHVFHHPAFAVFGGLAGPDALPAAQFRGWLEAAAGQELWDELAAGFGVKALYLGSIAADDAPGGLALSCGMRLADWNGLAPAGRAGFVAAARAAALEVEAGQVPVLPPRRGRSGSTDTMELRQRTLADLPRDDALTADIVASYGRALRMSRLAAHPGA